MRKYLEEKIQGLNAYPNNNPEIGFFENRCRKAYLEKLRGIQEQLNAEIFAKVDFFTKRKSKPSAHPPEASNVANSNNMEAVPHAQLAPSEEEVKFHEEEIEREYCNTTVENLIELNKKYLNAYSTLIHTLKLDPTHVPHPEVQVQAQDTSDAPETRPHLILELMRTAIKDLKESAIHKNLQAIIRNTTLPLLRHRLFLASKAKNEAELAKHLFDFYYEDFQRLNAEIESNPAHWKLNGDKTHLVVSDIENRIKEHSKINADLAELFYKETYIKMHDDILSAAQAFIDEANKYSEERAENYAAENEGATGELANISATKTAAKIRAALTAIRDDASLLFKDKIARCYTLALGLRESILESHSTHYAEKINKPAQKSQEEKRLIAQSFISRKPQQAERAEPPKITEENKIQKSFQGKHRPRNLSLNLRLAATVAHTVDRAMGSTPPSSVRETQSGFQALFNIGNLYINYFQKCCHSPWFKHIATATEKSALINDKTKSLEQQLVAPTGLQLLRAYHAFLETKCNMIEETLNADAWRSKLFNCRSLRLVDRAIELLQEEVNNPENQGLFKNHGLLNDVRAKSLEVQQRSTALNNKYSSFFFGIKKPEFNFSSNAPRPSV